jgi:hypothetical protein
MIRYCDGVGLGKLSKEDGCLAFLFFTWGCFFNAKLGKKKFKVGGKRTIMGCGV